MKCHPPRNVGKYLINQQAVKTQHGINKTHHNMSNIVSISGKFTFLNCKEKHENRNQKNQNVQKLRMQMELNRGKQKPSKKDS